MAAAAVEVAMAEVVVEEETAVVAAGTESQGRPPSRNT